MAALKKGIKAGFGSLRLKTTIRGSLDPDGSGAPAEAPLSPVPPRPSLAPAALKLPSQAKRPLGSSIIIPSTQATERQFSLVAHIKLEKEKKTVAVPLVSSKEAGMALLVVSRIALSPWVLFVCVLVPLLLLALFGLGFSGQGTPLAGGSRISVLCIVRL
jgi:hypothetical protein